MSRSDLGPKDLPAATTDARIVRDVRARIEELNQALAIAADAGLHVQIHVHPVAPGDGGAKPVTWAACAPAFYRIQAVDDGVTQQGGTA